MVSRKLFFQIVVLLALVVFMIGAKQECPYDPPYDATGEYEGDWWSGEGEHCPVSAEIIMDASPAPLPLWAPTAQFTVDFGCIEWPPELPPLDPMVLDSAGLLDDQGNLIFTSFGCTLGLCLLFDSHGVGIDEDADGIMDTYTGSWDFLILLAGFAPFGVTGEFELEALP